METTGYGALLARFCLVAFSSREPVPASLENAPVCLEFVTAAAVGLGEPGLRRRPPIRGEGRGFGKFGGEVLAMSA